MRDPVVTAIDCLVAGGGIGLGGIHWSHSALEGITSNYAVNVGRSNTRLDDRVRPLKSERNAVHSKGITIKGRYKRYTKENDYEDN